MLKGSVIMCLGMSTPPSKASGQGLQVMQFVHCLRIVCVIEKNWHVRLQLSQNTKGIKISLSNNVEVIVELNHNMLCVYRFSKGCNSGMTEHINLFAKNSAHLSF